MDKLIKLEIETGFVLNIAMEVITIDSYITNRKVDLYENYIDKYIKN